MDKISDGLEYIIEDIRKRMKKVDRNLILTSIGRKVSAKRARIEMSELQCRFDTFKRMSIDEITKAKK